MKPPDSAAVLFAQAIGPLPAATLLLGLAGVLAALLIGLALLRLARGTVLGRKPASRADRDRGEAVSAWDEAGRRMATPPATDEEPGDPWNEGPSTRNGWS